MTQAQYDCMSPQELIDARAAEEIRKQEGEAQASDADDEIAKIETSAKSLIDELQSLIQSVPAITHKKGGK